MDPALRELLRSGADAEQDDVEAIIRLDHPNVDVAGVRIVARFGPVATCRVRRDLILATWHHDNVVSLKCPRALGPEPVPDSPRRDLLASDHRRPDISPTGAGVVVGVVDWGCDFDHPNLKRPDGSTRLLGLWDQRGLANDRSPQPYGYGTFHDRQRIDDALRTGEPYDALGYHPAAADRDGRGAHGTHVLDIAAGNGLAGGPVGVAPGADLVFVHLAERGARGLANLGDSARILEAVDFIRRMAGGRPWVINLSVGRCGGPHDGSTLAELALDHVVGAAPNRFIVQSAGNYFDRSTHTSGTVDPGGDRSLTFITDPSDLTPNELEVWYPGVDELAARLDSPAGIRSPWVPLGGECDIVDGDGAVAGRLYHRRRDPNNGDNHLDLFLSPAAPAGVWNLTLRTVRVVHGGFHAWLERDEACGPCQARFVPDDVDRRTTTGTIANGYQTFVVGAHDGHSATRAVAPFSSIGPTRDGRPKPDCVAPGVEVLAARSAPPGSPRSPGLLTRKSGTSMAAPHVTGAVALCLEAARRPLTSTDIRALLQSTLEPAPSATSDSSRVGGGHLDVERLVAAATAITARKEHPMEVIPDRVSAARIRPDALYRHVAYRRDEPLPVWLDQSYVVLARPGEPPRMRPDRGDILVRVALGEPGRAHVAVLSSPELVAWHALDASGMPHEREGPGSYAPVVEDGPFPHGDSDRFARRILDRFGCLPPGQLLLRPRSTAAGRSEEDSGGGDEEGRGRQVGDPLGQRFHDLLWRPLRAGDTTAIEARQAELVRFVAALTPLQASAFLARLSPGGDLAKDLDERLSPTLARRIRELVTGRIGAVEAPAPAGPSQAGPSGGQGTTAKLDEDERRLLAAAAGTKIPLGSRRLFSRKVGRTLVYLEGIGEVEIKALQLDRATFEAYAELGRKGVGELELKMANALFGADATVKVSPDRGGGGSFSLSLGGGGFEFEVSPNPLSPVSLTVPLIELEPISFEKDLPSLGLRGQALVTLQLEIDVIPDYRLVAQTARAVASQAGQAGRSVVRSAASAVSRVERGGLQVARAGRAVWRHIVTRALDSVGKRIAMEWVRLLLRQGSKATMTAALRRTLGKAGGAIGAALIWWDAKSQAIPRLEAAIKVVVCREHKVLRAEFRRGYTLVLSRLAEPNWRSLMTGMMDKSLTHEWARFSQPFPRGYESYETFLVPRERQGPLRQWLAGPGRKFITVKDVDLAALDWEALLIDALRATVFARLFLGGKDDAALERIRNIARSEAMLCGAAAALQDVIHFIGANSDPTGAAGFPVDGLQQWEGVADLYRLEFGTVHRDRARAFEAFVDVDRIRLFPFADQDDSRPANPCDT